MSSLRETAMLISETADRGFMTSTQDLVIAGVRMTFPFKDAVETAEWNTTFQWRELDIYENLHALFQPDSLPDSWTRLIMEVGVLREAKGCAYPLDIIWGAQFLSQKYREYAQQIPIPVFSADFDTWLQELTQPDMVIHSINGILSDPFLRSQYVQLLSTYMVDMNQSGLPDQREVSSFIEQHPRQGFLVDFGCGLGHSVREWHELTGLPIIALERQYHIPWYQKFWKQEEQILFARADIAERVPLPDESVPFITMSHVVNHITHLSLVHIVREAHRVLVDKGYFFIGPQFTDDDSGWLVLQKRTTEFFPVSIDA